MDLEQTQEAPSHVVSILRERFSLGHDIREIQVVEQYGIARAVLNIDYIDSSTLRSLGTEKAFRGIGVNKDGQFTLGFSL